MKWAPREFCKAAASNSQYGIWVHTFAPPKKGCANPVRMENAKINHATSPDGDYDGGVLIRA